MGMELKWLLLLPVYRYAYIGMIANAYSKEQELGGVDYSVYEVMASTICGILLYGCYRFPITVMYCALAGVAAIWILLRYLENYTILKLFSTHPVIYALFSWVPGLMLWQATRAWKTV